MPDGLSRLECTICGQSIYFALPSENEFYEDGPELSIEVTCPRGHSDQLTVSELKSMDVSGRVEQMHLAAAAL